MLNALRRAVDARLDDLYALAASLVREQSLRGAEEGAQQVVEQRLRRLGFAVERVAIDADAALADPLGGYPALAYIGRTCVGGRMGGGDGASLHLSGHVDVVPIDAPERWTRDPFGAEIADGRMHGRGSGDMKGGLAAYLIAVEAFLAVAGAPRGDLLFTSVIEEECGGNGMRAVIGAGYDADATLIAEPTSLTLQNGGVGVIWARLAARGAGEHAANAAELRAPLDRLLDAIAALRALEERLNAQVVDGAFAGLAHPYNVNVGELRSGCWASSVPTDATAHVRIGFGRDLTPQQAQTLVAGALAAAAPDVELVFDGFRAHAYVHDVATPLAEVVAAAHADALGAPLRSGVSTATTDARYVAGPCYCYGPSAGQIHGIDEWVDLASLRDTALVAALAMTRWLEPA